LTASGHAHWLLEEPLGFWAELFIGMAVMILLVVLLAPGLWSSRLDIHKADDQKAKQKGKDITPGP
jgi:hypothetical protein